MYLWWKLLKNRKQNEFSNDMFLMYMYIIFVNKHVFEIFEIMVQKLSRVFQMSCKEKLISFILSKVYWIKWFLQFSLNSIHSFYFYASYIQCHLPLVLEVSLSFNSYSCFHSRRYIFQKPGSYARVSCRDGWKRNENLITWLNN